MRRAAQSRPFIHKPSEVPGTRSSRSLNIRPIRPLVAPARYSISTTLPIIVSRSVQNKSRRWKAEGVNSAFCCVPAGKVLRTLQQDFYGSGVVVLQESLCSPLPDRLLLIEIRKENENAKHDVKKNDKNDIHGFSVLFD